ncbi:ABC transporter ATP-binding protein [Dactylosporangium sp. CA-233914]|uniref:ABC transporter ATP-binding protein n=1 Tax=Dactylosporangium sp. CA-233914 TaxID=3239934 RepID=UPI003D90118D
METTVIEIDGLRMRYGDRDVLHGVGFVARRGEILALLGPNGAGKSTSIEILEGFRRRSGGDVAVLGVDPGRGGEDWRGRIGIVLQSWRDHGKWAVRELLAHLARYYPGAWDTDALIAAVGLGGVARQRIRTLSGGQRRRLDLAIGIVGRPEVLFLDEPTTGLDPQARREFHRLIEGLAAEHGTTVLLTTHDLDEAERLAGRIVILDGGRVVADGRPDELARGIAGADEVRWTLDGRRHTEATADSTGFAFELFRRHGAAVRELEIRRASLEDTYLALVRAAEGADR